MTEFGETFLQDEPQEEDNKRFLGRVLNVEKHDVSIAS